MTPVRRNRVSLPVVLLVALPLACAPGDGPAGDAGEGSDAGEAPPPAATATTAPESEIWLGEVVWDGELPAVSGLRNVTDRPGYDNQPFFLPDGTFVYTRQEAGQTDIWRYDPADGSHARVTETDVESEYSAKLIPGDGALEAAAISVIRVEADGTQRLWRFPLAGGGDPEVIFPDIAPVGYHAWVDGVTAYLFVLGSPATLHLARVGTPGSTVLASDIGRSIRDVPGSRRTSYVQYTGEGRSEIRLAEPGVDGSVLAAPGLEGGDFHAWTPDGRILQARGNVLHVFDPDDPDAGWREVASVDPGLVLTRIAVSGDGARVALVAQAAGGA